MKGIEQYPLAELKLIYRLLHAQLPEQMHLIDSDLLHDLQTYLQQQATRDGIDIAHHAQWARWLETESQIKRV